jgi:hypothetical protein
MIRRVNSAFAAAGARYQRFGVLGALTLLLDLLRRCCEQFDSAANPPHWIVEIVLRRWAGYFLRLGASTFVPEE